ncbi:DMT family transporter [bacterium 210917-SL.2.15]|nr:DMT family transporter [bacterium 210917-SL.2.15]
MKQKHTAILYILLAALFFSGMTAFVHLSGDLPTGQKALFRNLPALFIAAFTLWRKGISPLGVAPVNQKPMFWRCLFGTAGLLCNFYAIDHLVLSDANMLNKLSPFFAVILSYFILKEKVRPVQAAGLTAAFAGALLIIKPSFHHVDYVPALIGALGGLGAGAAYTFVRKMGLQGEEGARIVFYFSLFSCVVTLPMFLVGGAAMAPWQFFCLLAAGLCGAGGQFSITKAYCYAPAREISVYDYTQVLFAAVWGFVLFGQRPDALSVLGYVVIVGAAVWMYCYNRRRAGGGPDAAAPPAHS